MKIQVCFFSVVRDIVGTDARQLSLPDGSTAAVVLETLGADHPRLLEWKHSIRFAVNQTYAPAETVLNEGDEVALIPPTSGG